MKKIQSWKTFNELKRSTYYSAAKQAEKYGNKKLSDKFKNHASFMDELDNKKRMDILEKEFSSIEPFKFSFTEPGNDNVHNLTGKYLGIDPAGCI